MTDKIESKITEVLPSITEIWDKLSELFKNKEHKDMFSSILLNLVESAKASQKKSISSWVRGAIEDMYKLIKN